MPFWQWYWAGSPRAGEYPKGLKVLPLPKATVVVLAAKGPLAPLPKNLGRCVGGARVWGNEAISKEMKRFIAQIPNVIQRRQVVT